MEDLPTLLQRQYGLKPQGKGAPMSSSNKSPISNSNSNYNSNSTYEQPFSFTAAHNYDNNNNNFSYNSFDDDDMFGLFAQPQNQKPSFSSPTVDDMLGTFNYPSTTTTTTPVSGYVDVLFGGIGSANTTNAKTTTTSSSSSPFAVFEDDVFGMSTSSSSDNVFGMANKAPSFSPLDDLFGGDFSTNSFKPSNSKPKPKPASVSKAARGGPVPRPGPVFEVEDLIKDIGISNCSPSQGPIFEEVEGEPEERRRARWERYQRTKNRADQALREKTERDLQVQREQAERNSFAETLDLEVKRWAAGKEGNLRALLSTLQSILWPGAGWHSVSLMDVITSQAVKKVYKKAALCVHPDKMQQKGASIEQKYIAEKVFDLLKLLHIICHSLLGHTSLGIICAKRYRGPNQVSTTSSTGKHRWYQ